MIENITRIEKRIDEIERKMEEKYTQQTQTEQQIQVIRNENQETGTRICTEVKDVVRDEVTKVRT